MEWRHASLAEIRRRIAETSSARARKRLGERLAVRNMLDELRSGGQITGGPANFNAKDKQAFANQFDRWLTKAGG